MDPERRDLLMRILVDNSEFSVVLSIMCASKRWKEYACENILRIAENDEYFDTIYRYFGLLRAGWITEEVYDKLKVRVRSDEKDFDSTFRCRLPAQLRFMPTKLLEYFLGEEENSGFTIHVLIRFRVPGKWIRYHLEKHDWDEDLCSYFLHCPKVPEDYLLDVVEAMKDQHYAVSWYFLYGRYNKEDVPLLCKVVELTGNIRWFYDHYRVWVSQGVAGNLDNSDIEKLLEVAKDFNELKPRFYKGDYLCLEDWRKILLSQHRHQPGALTVLWEAGELKEVIDRIQEGEVGFAHYGEAYPLYVLGRFVKIFQLLRNVDIRASMVKTLENNFTLQLLIGAVYEGEKAPELRACLDRLGLATKEGLYKDYNRTWHATCSSE